MTAQEYKEFLYSNAAIHILDVTNPSRDKSRLEGFNAFQIADILSIVFCESNDSVIRDLFLKVEEIRKQRLEQLNKHYKQKYERTKSLD